MIRAFLKTWQNHLWGLYENNSLFLATNATLFFLENVVLDGIHSDFHYLLIIKS